jgi:hypothetical protein
MATLPRNRTLLGNLIGAVASIAVALVGVLPHLRAQDRETIATQQARLEELAQKREQERQTIAAQQARIDELAQKVEAFQDKFEVGTKVRWNITGRIRGATADSGRAKYELYLVPGTKHFALPSDDGRFVFEDLFPGSYALIVRDLDTRSYRTARGLITPEWPEGTLPLESHGAWADYKAAPRPVQTAAADPQPGHKAGTALAAASLRP